jgi:hypothetical protein
MAELASLAWSLGQGRILIWKDGFQTSSERAAALGAPDTYTASSFVAYIGTSSDHLLLPEGRRAELPWEIQAALPDTVEADRMNLYVAPLT